MKMKTAYEQNPSMGDPNSVEGQLKENSHKMDKLQSELKKFLTYMDEIDHPTNGSNSLNPGHDTPNSGQRRIRNSITSNHDHDQDSLSRSASDSSFCHQQNQFKTNTMTTTTKLRDSVTAQNNFINHNHNNLATNSNNHNNQVNNKNNLQSPKKNG